MKTTSRRLTGGLFLAAVLLTTAGTASADVLAQITKKASGQTITGMTRWLPASKQYALTTRDGVTLKISPRDVAGIKVKTPEQLERAAQLVTQGRPSPAIPVLQKIADDYVRLQWDTVAGKYLVQAYLDSKDPKKAAEVGDAIVSRNPPAGWDKELGPPYWEALVQTEQYGKLRGLLKEAIQVGDRDLAAVAQVRQGDIDRRKGKLKEAVVDGYLRTAYFFQSVKSVQPEALYKAMKCFEDLGQQGYAEKMRKRLLAEYPNDPYTEKAKLGS